MAKTKKHKAEKPKRGKGVRVTRVVGYDIVPGKGVVRVTEEPQPIREVPPGWMPGDPLD
jgi:hypothetical protein